jgi:ribosome recycling factor
MDDFLNDTRQKMQKVIEALVSDVATLRAGRASPALIENITIDAYGGTQRLKIMEMGTVSVTDPHTLVISPWDVSQVEDIRKGIAAANVGLTPVTDGEVVRINIPPLTEERRKELVKALHQKTEAGRVMIRQVRHELMVEFKKQFEEKILAEDERSRREEELQKTTTKFMTEIDRIGDNKVEELMTV